MRGSIDKGGELRSNNYLGTSLLIFPPPFVMTRCSNVYVCLAFSVFLYVSNKERMCDSSDEGG